MSDAANILFDWTSLTDDRAEILEAYFALYRERDPTTIGSGEITRWFREQGRYPPSESLIRTVLAAVGVPPTSCATSLTQHTASRVVSRASR